jgi:hypothetical protein
MGMVNVAAVRHFYSIGKRSLARYPGRMKYGKLSKEAERFGVSTERLGKARTFFRVHASLLLEEFVDEIKRGGFPIGPDHLTLLLRIRPNQRLAMLRKTIAGHWSCRRMADEIRKLVGQPRSMGRPIRATPDDYRDRVVRHCETWGRLSRSIKAMAEEDQDAGDGDGLSIPSAVERRLQAVDKTTSNLLKYLLKK